MDTKGFVVPPEKGIMWEMAPGRSAALKMLTRETAGSVMFNIELQFAGVFRIQNVPQDQVQPLVLIECPRLLFPFAREIIATSVRDGGFPPLMLDPVDFVSLYRQNMERQQTGQTTLS